MAVSVEAAFVLLDKASGPLKDIQRQAILTDKALDSMGGSTSGTSKLRSFTSDLEAARGGMKDVTGETVTAAREIKKLGGEVDRTGNFFSRRLRDMKNWIGGTSTLASVTRGAASGASSLWGALTGAVTAFPPLITAVTLAAPAIVSLGGALGALVSSLTFAVGGGALLGGGLLGSFAVGLGSLVAVAKPALSSLKSYQDAVKQLNTAEQSGSATAVKAAQKRLDAIDKANPGVKKLADNLSGLEGAWKKATAPARKELFGVAGQAIHDLRKNMSWLGPEANKNVGAIADAFKKYILPLFNSKAFKDFVQTLGDIFRKNLPGFAKGVVDLFKGFGNILKDLAPTLDKTGGGFAKIAENFDKWTSSSKGKKTIGEMVDAFKQWMNLLKGVARIFLELLGAGTQTGTKAVKGWGDALNKFADKLSGKGGTKGIQNFFEQAMKKTEDLWPILKNVATALADIYKVFKPLSEAAQWVLRNFPAPLVAAIVVAVLGRNIITGAFKAGTKTAGALARFASRRGSPVGSTLASVLSEQGSTMLKPMYVYVVNEGFGGGPLKTATTEAAEAAPVGFAARWKGRIGSFLSSDAMKSAVQVGGGLIVADMINSAFSQVVQSATTGRGQKLSQQAGLPASVVAQLDKTTNAKGWNIMSPVMTNRPWGATGQALVAQSLHALDSGDSTQIQAVIKKAQDLEQIFPQMKAPLKDFVQAMSDQITKTANTVQAQLTGNQPGSVTNSLKKVAPQFAAMAGTAGTDLANIESNTQTTVQAIQDQLGTKSAAATQALATNYAIAADAVKTSMQDGVIKNTKDGIAEVHSLMTKAFQELGISPNIAKKLSSQGWSLKAVSGGQASIKASGIGPNQPYATGGRLPGAPSGDHLPLLGRGGSVLGIADGGELVVNRHTEGRVNAKLAAYGTTLGKEVAGETQPHFANGGRIPRYGYGGVVGEVNRYFSQRGWDKAAIAGILGNAMQESTMNPNTPGGGLWQQISNFGSSSGGSLQNQMNRMYPQIVGLRSAMNRSSPAGAATIFESQFEKAGIPALANRIMYAQQAYAGKLGAGLTGGSMTAPTLKAPSIGGFGFQQAFGQANVNAYTAVVNRVLARAAMSSVGGVGGVGGGVSTAGVRGAGGLGTYDGLRVANWIIPILNWAAGHGWSGRITSGYRPGSVTTSGNVSNHSKTSYPGGAVDVGGPDASSEGLALWNVVRNYPGTPKLYSAAYGPGSWTGYTDSSGAYHVHDYGHFSATGHALGGRLPWFQSGADFIARRPTVIGVGDGPGAERVTVTPQNQNTTTNRPVTINIGVIEVNRKGDVKKIVDEELQLLADSIGRQL